MITLLRDIEQHLRLFPPIYALVREEKVVKIFSSQIPDKQSLPYILLERTEERTKRTSGDSIVVSTITITSFADTVNGAETLALFVDTRMQKTLLSTPPAKTLDQKPDDNSVRAEPDRGEGGTFRYRAPIVYKVWRQVPREG